MRIPKTARIFLIAVVLSFPGPALFSQGQGPSQESEADLNRMRGMSLADLLDTELTVTGGRAQTARESTGIVSFITAEEIHKSGATGLLDVLRLVQGFEFGVDVHGVVGLGFRGNWGYEGKILLLVDGQEYNELLYYSVPMGNHFPIDQIKRIEIIRGPGSVMYGGTAELAVINIITFGPGDVNGVRLHGTAGTYDNSYARVDGGVVSGYSGKDFQMSASAYFGQGTRSDHDYADIYGDTYNLKENTLAPRLVNLAVSGKGFHARFLMDRYMTKARDSWGVNLPYAIQNNFISWFLDASYEWRPTPKLKIVPQIQLKRQLPFEGTSAKELALGYYYDIRTDRRIGKITAEYEASRDVSLLMGAEYRHDFAESRGPEDLIQWFSEHRRTLDYTNSAFFVQGSFHTALADFTGGLRFEHHSQFGSSVAPRFAMTRTEDKWHFKLLLAKAFRAPSIMNIDYNPHIRPEKCYTAEIEAGYRPRKDIYVTGNVFYMTMRDTIVYYNDAETGYSNYCNFDETTTWGAELDLRWKTERFDIHGGYSWYRLARNDAVMYRVEGNDKALLGFPNHKLTLSATVSLPARFCLNSSLTVLSRRWGYVSDGEGEMVPHSFSPKVLCNAFVLRENLFREGLDLGFGVKNIGDADYAFIQPYRSSHPPLPGASREFFVKLSYRFEPKH